jgi:hypothetical protein
MKANIDIEIMLYPENAFGNVSGSMSFTEIPAVGDSISFLMPKELIKLQKMKNFTGILKVQSKMFLVNTLNTDPVLGLGTIIVEDTGSAKALMEYFEIGFGLEGNPYR